MNTFTIKRLLGEEWKRIGKRQLWLDLKNQKNKIKMKGKEKLRHEEMIHTFNINQLEFLLNNDINTPEMRNSLIGEELSRQLFSEKEKRKENTKFKKSIWLIRHGEKDMTKATYYMESFREMNFDWALSENGLLQARSVAEVLREQYENATNPPLIFASPFRRTMHTALYVANALNLKIQIEDGLVEKRHGLWNRTKMTDCFSKHIKYFNTHYKSKFCVTKNIIEPIAITVLDDVSRSRILKNDFTFDANVANYFLKMFHEEKQDIIIIGHQVELYNIQRVLTGSKAERDKITCASMFQYALSPISLKFELKSYFEQI